MKQPLWKRLLSHVYELHIESVSSEYNPHMYVSLNRGRYQLCTANAIYSFEDLYSNFSAAFKLIDLDKLPIENVLVLGFGLGSIPMILERTMNKQYNYVAVEIDESVVYLASKYAVPQINSKLEIITADAFAFVMQCEQQFDMITVDLFLDDIIPQPFQEQPFLQKLKSLLTPNGVLLYNHLAATTKDKIEAKDFYENKFHPIFPEGTYQKVISNWMMMNNKNILK